MDYITVKVGLLPGTIKEVTLNGGRAVSDALEGAEISSADGYEIRINSELGATDTELKDGDVVLLVKQIKGN